MTFDVAIVGAGIVGAACAAALSSEGLSVVVLDSGDIASGTTAAGMGHIVVMDDSPAQFALTRYSQELWNELSNDLPPSAEYERCGTIWIAADDDEMAAVRQKKELYEKHGLKAHVLDEKSLREAEPHLKEGLAGGLRVDSDSVVYQPCAAAFLIERAKKFGATIRTGEKVLSISSEGVTLANGETLRPGKTINAAGISAPALVEGLDIKKRKGHLVITERYTGFVRHQLIELGYLKSAHLKDADTVAFNLQPRNTGQILLGSSRQFGADHTEVDRNILRKMIARSFEYMPKLKSLAAIRIWTGFRPATPDNLPYIGKMPGQKNLYVAAGHEGLGITTSLGTARLLADEILGRTSAIAIEPYSPTRRFRTE